MKKIYNNSINAIITGILALPLLVLIVLKYAIKIVAKILKAISTIVRVCIRFIQVLRIELVEVLSVKD